MSDGEKLDLVLQNLFGLKEDVSGLKEDVSGLKEDVSHLKEDVSDLKEDVSDLKKRMTGVERKVQDACLILENETNPNIRAIADGHLDLSRKLDEALKVNNEKEILIIRVNGMESELKRLKQRIDEIA